MSDPVSEVFGYVLIAVAVLLALRERHAFRHRGADGWLITRRRYRRRMLVSTILALVGGLIAAWGHGYIDLRDADTGVPSPTVFMVFVFTLLTLSLLLMVLAMMDLTETARNASRHAMEEFPLPGDKPDSSPTEPSAQPPSGQQ